MGSFNSLLDLMFKKLKKAVSLFFILNWNIRVDGIKKFQNTDKIREFSENKIIFNKSFL